MNRAPLLASVVVATMALAQPIKPQPSTVAPYVSYTTKALTLYVDGSLGSDSASCSGSGTAACLTMAGAFAKVPHGIKHTVTINVASGTYAGLWLQNYFIDHSVSQTTNAGIYIVGTLSAFSPATGSNSGTSTSAAAASYTTGSLTTMTDSGQTWTVSNLKGKLVTFSSGTLSGKTLQIIDNTATQLTISGGISPGTGATYAIKNYSTTFSGSSFTAPPVVGVAGIATNQASSYDWYISNVGSGTDSITFQNIAFTLSTFSGIFVGQDTWASFVNCKFGQGSDSRPMIALGYMAHVSSWGNQYVFSQNNHSAFKNSTFGIDSSTSQSIGFQEAFVNSNSDWYYSIGTKQGYGFLTSGVRVIIQNGYFNNVARAIWSGGGAFYWFSGIIDTADQGITASLGVASNSGVNIDIASGYFTNCATVAVRADGPGNAAVGFSGTAGGATNGIGVQADNGATIRIVAGTNIGATNETQVEGVNMSLATLRAASPTYNLGAKTGARIYQ